MRTVVIVAETGADIPPELADACMVRVVPMHVAIGDENLNDGQFPITDIYEYYRKTQKIPSTSATSPEEYRTMFELIHEEEPEAQILHLCYSAVTTATYQNSLIGSEGMDYVTHIDTKCVSWGQGLVVTKVAGYLNEHPQATLQDAVRETQYWIEHTHFGFLPGGLEFLRAGGRVSNVAYLGASILNLKPLIEIINGELVCTRKYRGNMKKVSSRLIVDTTVQYRLKKEELYLVYSEGLSDEVKRTAEETARSQGYQSVSWMKTGGVITCHGGPAAFGVVGIIGDHS